MSSVLSDSLGNSSRIAVLSGPTFAREVARGLPTAVVAASENAETAQRVATLFHSESLRVYRSSDVAGVELGGVVKNVIALAAGIVEGMGLGLNAQAALITRGLAEMKRLIESAGGSPLTVMGLSGLGDLLLTATGELSRNRCVGMALGKGAPLAEALKSVGQVAEGVRAAKQVTALAAEGKIEMPIALEVSRIIAGEITPAQASKNLLARALRDE
jgi:glycerol-3-phosphate dehydrogenase (NAD(P)+)